MTRMPPDAIDHQVLFHVHLPLEDGSFLRHSIDRFLPGRIIRGRAPEVLREIVSAL